MFWFQIQDSFSWGTCTPWPWRCLLAQAFMRCFQRAFSLRKPFHVRNSTGVKNEHTHQCRRKGAFPASLPAIPPGAAAISGAASRARRHLVVPAGWRRQAGRCAGQCRGGPVVGDIALAAMERRESTVKEQPLQNPVKPLWDVPV